MTKHRAEVEREAPQGFGANVGLRPASLYLSERDGKSKINDLNEITRESRTVKNVIKVKECFGLAENAYPFKMIKGVKL